MRNLTLFLFFGMIMSSPLLAPNPQFGDLDITAPSPGDVLQGVVLISGTNNVAGFVSAEISFTYAGDTTGTWFQIAMNNQPVLNGTLATWDTTVITDGDYIIRLRVY